MKKNLLVVILSWLSLVTAAQCLSNVNFNSWSPAGYPNNGSWSVQNGGSQIYQGTNGAQSFFVSPFDLMNVHLTGSFRSNDNDNDWMGFVFSFLNPINPIDTFDCWLYDWKQEAQGGASSGMSLCRLNGYISPNPPPGVSDHPNFWDHQSSPQFTVVDNNFGGPGWNQGQNHNFELYLTYTRATIFIDGAQAFDWQDCFKPGRFGFYNFSQSDCIYSNFNYELYIDYAYDDKACLGSPAAFSFIDPCVTSLGQYQTLTWHFGDGTPDLVINNPTLSTVNTTHIYTAAGVYNTSLTVVDMNGCTATATHPIDVRTPITISSNPVNPLCNGGSNGSIQALPSGGFGGYSYLWNNGNIAQTLPGLTAGTYTVTVTDGNCQTSAQFTLNQPTALTATTSHTDAPCGSNGTATVTIAGGTPPYTGVNWAGIAANGSGTSSLPAGTWIADFRDANNCSALLQYSETIASLPCGITSSTSKTNVTCFGGSNGSATLTVTTANPPQNITWSNGGTGSTISNLPAGTYTYNYTDGLPAHAFSGSITITQPSVPMTVQMTTTGIACAGSNTGQATASVVSGGVAPYTYTWSGGHPNNPVVPNLGAGPISVTVTDNNGCTGTASGTISSVPSLAIAFTTIIDSCYYSAKGKAFVHVSGGSPPYSYEWNNFGTDTANLNLVTGTYTITVTDFNGCTATGSTLVGGPTSGVTKTQAHQNILCNGASTGSITINISGGTPGYSYTWNPSTLSGTNPTGLAAGVYNFTATDVYGCSIMGADTLREPATALTAVTSHTNVTCHGANDGTVTITVGGGTPPYSYLGNPIPAGTTTIPGLAPATYAGNVTDANACAVAVSETVTDPGVQTLNVSSTNATCNGATDGSATAVFTNPTGSVTYNWSGGLTGSPLTNVGAGTYDVTATDGNNCTLTGTTTITEPAAAVLPVTATDAACFGGNGSATANPAGGTLPYTYTWSNGAGNLQTITPPAGNYTVTATDASSCNQTGSFTINQPTGMTVQIASSNVSCFGAATGTITLTVTGGSGPNYTYTWNPNVSSTGSATGLAAATYNITITDQASCTLDTVVTITQPAAPLSAVTVFTDVTCFGLNDGTITTTPAGGTGPYTYTWNPNVSSTGSATGLAAGSYSVTISDANSCTLVETATITEPVAALAAVPSQVDLICNGVSTGEASVVASGGTTPYTYTWNPNVGNGSSVTALAAGQYGLTVTDDHACTVTVAYTLTEPPLLIVSESHLNVQCAGGSDGQITLTASGGTPGAGYTYQWNPNVSTTNLATGLAAGSYAYTVTDANACTTANSTAITQPVALDVTATPTDVICFSQLNGIVAAVASNGTAPYSLTITNDGINFQNDVNGQFTGL
ncbi:MAG TPA: PKD domain-containing protein, partial [Chitinophagales bacterium]|nr:PKD domain-containing protein [Chitinophagales bacterium]